MAFKQKIVLPNGFAGDYLRVDHFQFDRRSATIYAQLALFMNEARANEFPDYPLCVVAILNLSGPDFHRYFSEQALAEVGGDILGQLYRAFKTEKLRPCNGIVVNNLKEALDV